MSEYLQDYSNPSVHEARDEPALLDILRVCILRLVRSSVIFELSEEFTGDVSAGLRLR